MKYNFDEIINRQGTQSMKWDPSALKDQFGQEDLLPMWVADMDFKCPEPVIKALADRVAHGIYGYTQRDEAYYNAVMGWMEKRHGWTIEKEWMVFTPGIVPAVNFILQSFCRPGDQVIIQNPVYYPFLNAINNNGCRPLFNRLQYREGKYTMDFGDLEEKARDPRTKILILCSPHNPVGRVWTKEELIRLGEICLKNKVWVISDEIHSDLILKGHTHTPFAKLSEAFAMGSITCTAPSKTFNIAGLQTSNLIIPNGDIRQELIRTLERHHVQMSNCFGVTATTAAYTHGEEWLEQMLDYLQGNVEFIQEFLEERMPEVKLIRPEGTYLAWLDFTAVSDNAPKLENLIQKKAGVALDEGYIFGAGGEGFERINIACPRILIEKALKRIQAVIH